MQCACSAHGQTKPRLSDAFQSSCAHRIVCIQCGFILHQQFHDVHVPTTGCLVQRCAVSLQESIDQSSVDQLVAHFHRILNNQDSYFRDTHLLPDHQHLHQRWTLATTLQELRLHELRRCAAGSIEAAIRHCWLFGQQLTICARDHCFCFSRCSPCQGPPKGLQH